jgi:glycosyltransferase involved in cell wall biosynthesis
MSTSNAIQPPAVSVVVATYNRSNVLTLALQSLIAQTFQNWECWVIGDACTDDTEQVVTSLGDPRIRFHNLPVNIGEQSGPNNEGVRRSRGQYIAYLNHDDLWFPDHLETMLVAIKQGHADVVFSLLATIKKSNAPHRMTGPDRDGRWDPRLHVPASSWLLTRDAYDRVGPWRNFRAIYLFPSLDWMFRAWKLGLVIECSKQLTVIHVPSTKSMNVYKNRDDSQQREYVERMQRDPGVLREMELLGIALSYRSHYMEFQPAQTLLAQAVINLYERACLSCGFHPIVLRNMLRYGKRGGMIDQLRARRGLPPLR